MAKQRTPLGKETADAFNKFQELQPGHRSFVEKVERGYKSYLAVVEQRSMAARWTHKLAPPYAMHIAETMVASLLDERLRFQVTPFPRMYDHGEFGRLVRGAKAMKILLDWQLQVDRFDEFQRPFVLQALYSPLTVAKTHWQQRNRLRKRLVMVSKLARDADGLPLGYVPAFEEREEPETIFDGPHTEVVDVTDFYWDDAAVSLDTCATLAHAVYYTVDELKQLEAVGRFKNIDQLADTEGSVSAESQYRRDYEKAKSEGRHEVLEIWRRGEKGWRVFTLGDRVVDLDPGGRDNPHWHGEQPFTACSLQPLPFKIAGVSLIEKIADLQEALTSILNQRLDNLELSNMAIVMFRADIDDPDSYEFYPGAKWLVDDPEQVKMWTPNVIPAEVSLGAEGIIKGDMQNLGGSFPFTSSTESQTVDQKTATGASIVTSLAQRAITSQKKHLYDAYKRIIQQRGALNQQFIRDPVYVQVVGLNNEPEFEEIVPMLLQGEYLYDFAPMNESLMRSERRAEAQALFQIVTGALQPLTLGHAPPNLRAFVEDLLEAFDKNDMERYFGTAPPDAAQAGQPAQPAQPDGQPPSGVTGPQSIDPAVSPSNQVSHSGEQFLHRLLTQGRGAGQGGAVNGA